MEDILAELHGKISAGGSNLHERLEDNLTGNFFGCLRYIPFDKGIRPILLNAVFPREAILPLQHIHMAEWDQCVSFWPHDKEGELDLLIDLPDCVIGIEVKYLSGLSSRDSDETDDAATDFAHSQHQLIREARILHKKGQGKEKILLFIADQQDADAILKEMRSKPLQDVRFGVVSWQDILHEVKRLKNLSSFEAVIQADFIRLLQRKGFEAFHGFALSQELGVEEDSYLFDQSPFRFSASAVIDGGMYYAFG